MTGFARAESSNGDRLAEVTIRSVNHRFLDLKIRSPQELEQYDPVVRRVAKESVKRGQLQISIALRCQTGSALKLNRELAEAYLGAYRELASLREVETPPDLNALLRVQGILTQDEGCPKEEDAGATEGMLKEALQAALAALNAERLREGEGIAADLRARSEAIAADTAALEGVIDEMTVRFRERLERRLSELLGDAAIEPQRLLQEAALLADRTDISEELQRLSAHAKRLLEMLDEGGEVGKQIDFLAQEMNREANTMLSKTTPLGEAGLPVTDVGLRLKAEIEKIREQAQNLE